jgi:flagellar hook-associated protein 3 FlgL
MPNNVSSLGQLLDNNARLRDIRFQLNTLQIQLATGKKTQVFSGLGDNGITSQRTRVALDQIEIFQTNITIGQTRLRQMTQNMSEFSEQAKNLADTMGFALQQGDVDIGSLKTAAQDTLSYIRDLLNSRDGERYLFSGADSFSAPLEDTGAHASYITGLIEDWRTGTIDSDALIAAYSATPETTIGYSASLSSGLTRGVYVRASTETDVDYTLLANSQGFKEILNAITLMAGMDLDKIELGVDDNPALVRTAPGADATEQKENFFKVYENMITRINAGINLLRTEEQRLQRADVLLNNIAQEHTFDSNTLANSLGTIEDADPAEVSIKINSLQTQLSAAYQVTALLGTLSLTNYIQ